MNNKWLMFYAGMFVGIMVCVITQISINRNKESSTDVRYVIERYIECRSTLNIPKESEFCARVSGLNIN